MNKHPLPIDWIERIFMRLHGRFGNNFTDKFKIGQIDKNGRDIGIENAKQVWSEELAGISPDRIKTALLHQYEYAPSCDQFKAQCKSTTQAHTDFLAIEKKITPEIKAENKERLHVMMKQLGWDKRINKTHIV